MSPFERYELRNVLDMNFFTLKMKEKAVDDLDGNCHAKLLYYRGFVCQNWRF